MNTKNLLVGIGLCLLSACTEVDNKLEVDRALEYCDRQVHRTLEVMHGKGGFLHAFRQREYLPQHQRGTGTGTQIG